MDIRQAWENLNVEKEIGSGSYGTVYKCMEIVDGREEYSAVKVISVPQDNISDSEIASEGMTLEETKEYYKDIVNDFLAEIKILESLKNSPNVVNIYDYKVIEKENGIGFDIYIKMELLSSFNDYISNKKLDEKQVVKLGLDLCNALETCSAKKIIHRDIKPENIFVDGNGNFKLGDFGVAKQLERTEASMSRKGTYNYMAPEVLSAKKYDSRADIYSLGIVMYKLLNNNRLPFLDPDKQIIRYTERQEAFEKRMLGEKIPPLKNAGSDINNVILKACEFDPEYRFRTVSEFKYSLRRIEEGARVGVDIRTILKKARKHPAISVISIVLVIAIMSGTIGYGISRTNRKNGEPTEKTVTKIIEITKVKEEKAEDKETTKDKETTTENESTTAGESTTLNEQNKSATKKESAASANKATLPQVSGTISGYITNAMNGSGISGATIKVRSGSGNKTGSVYKTTTSGSNGSYSINVAAGQYTIEVSKSGYISSYTNITSSGAPIEIGISITQNIPTGEMRIVLNWGAEPRDLDAHLKWDSGHVFYSNKSATIGSNTVTLDVDDTECYGPETITISNPYAAEYMYYVHNFSGTSSLTSSLTSSHATVTVYYGDRQYATYNVPTSGSGNAWEVFKIKNGQIQVINRITS